MEKILSRAKQLYQEKKIPQPLTEEDIHHFVFSVMNPKGEKNNVTSQIEGTYVTQDYFNSKLYLLTDEIKFINKQIIEIKGFFKTIVSEYKEFSGMIDKLTHLILTVIKMYYVNDPENSVKNLDENQKNIVKNISKIDSSFDVGKFKEESDYSISIKQKNIKTRRKRKNSENKFNIFENKIENNVSELDEFANIDLDKIDFELEIPEKDSENRIILDSNSEKNFSDKESQVPGSVKPNLIKNVDDENYTDQKTNFLYSTDDRQVVFNVYFNIQGYANLDKFVGVEEDLGNGKFMYYLYFHCRRKKRIKTVDLENSKKIDVNFRKINIKNYLNEKGRIFFDPFNIKKAALNEIAKKKENS